MATKTVQDSSLTAIADAIRAKTGKSASMEFPTEFVSEIGSISGGGGGDYFQLLDEIAVTEDVRAVNIDLTDYSGYRDLIIVENVTLSASDWMYYLKDGSAPSGGSYDNQTSVKDGLCGGWFRSTVGNTFANILPSAAGFTMTNGKFNSLYVYTYYATTRMLSGSTFRIYGREA